VLGAEGWVFCTSQCTLTTHWENLEMSGNSKVVREKSW